MAQPKAKPEKLTVLADGELAEALRAERDRIAREIGLKTSLSATAGMLIRRGLDADREAAQ